MAEILIEYGADPLIRNANNESAWTSVIKAGQFNMIACIAEKTMHQEEKVSHSHEALEAAIEARRLDIVQLLLSHGARSQYNKSL